jgi:2-keto-4-pentenoate hydratase/2-oxohepta-3-ene-1,7-dioic acid hydratase in catechol pathway
MGSRRDFMMGVGGAGIAAAALSAPSAVRATSPAGDGAPGGLIKGVKLLAMHNSDGTETLGAVIDQGVIDIRAAATRLRMPTPLTLDDLLQRGHSDQLLAVIAKAKATNTAIVTESSVRHGLLFTRPGKIVCVGLNYRQHANEMGVAMPRVPPLFNKYNNALAGQNCIINLPPSDIAVKFDYETELLAVIGKTARNVSVQDALGCVVGFCTSNDFSARDLQTELPAGQWMIGKTLDQFGPIGPYFVTTDLVGDPHNLKLETHVNGELRQSANTSELNFNIPQLVAYISKYWRLEPGDLIFTGTPQGVIMGYPKDKQVWLKPGDKVVSTIEKLGALHVTLA